MVPLKKNIIYHHLYIIYHHQLFIERHKVRRSGTPNVSGSVQVGQKRPRALTALVLDAGRLEVRQRRACEQSASSATTDSGATGRRSGRLPAPRCPVCLSVLSMHKAGANSCDGCDVESRILLGTSAWGCHGSAKGCDFDFCEMCTGYLRQLKPAE